MINYQQKEGYIAVKWKKTQIGRTYCVGVFQVYVYRPRGCGGLLESEPFDTLEELKAYLERPAITS